MASKHPLSLHKRKHPALANKYLAAKDPIFPKISFPSDRLTLGELRAAWPEPEDLAAYVREVRVMEEDIAMYARVPPEVANEPLMKPDRDQTRSDLESFYIWIGLAAGPHSAKLLLRDIEEQARRLYPYRRR